ncbi:geranylgeranylglycerol-phosphate geranylgeranyltransferase [Rapidithrix thailandica]|uniref:Geranylgeranylglycerol-phosphate geranylgeranyltransferase n=1 Tax=Rapidithrix thailandica TaxID=413964 RepID=A0AAW9SHW3_9BACT
MPINILRAFVSLVRIRNLLIIFCTQWAAYLFLIQNGSFWWEKLAFPPFWLLSLSTVLIAAAGYLINDYYDIETDLINKPDKVVIGKSLSARTALKGFVILNTLGILSGFGAATVVGWVNGWLAVVLWAYSKRLKGIPLLGNLIVAGATSEAVLILAPFFQTSEHLIYIFTAFSFFLNLIREIVKDLEDREGDLQQHWNTLPLQIGEARTKYLVYGVLAGFISFVVFELQFLQNKFLTYYFLCTIPFGGYFVVRFYRASSPQEYHFLSSFCKMMMLTGILAMAGV